MIRRSAYHHRRPEQALDLRIAPPLPVRLRWMVRADLFDVLSIEAASFARPRTEMEIRNLLVERNTIGMVAVRSEANDHPEYAPVLGFMIYELHLDRLEVLAFAVDPAHRRRRVGRQMAAKLAAKLGPRRPRACLTASERGTEGLLFWRAMSWRATELVRGHFGPDTDGVRFVRAYQETEGADEDEGTACEREGGAR